MTAQRWQLLGTLVARALCGEEAMMLLEPEQLLRHTEPARELWAAFERYELGDADMLAVVNDPDPVQRAKVLVARLELRGPR